MADATTDSLAPPEKPKGLSGFAPLRALQRMRIANAHMDDRQRGFFDRVSGNVQLLGANAMDVGYSAITSPPVALVAGAVVGALRGVVIGALVGGAMLVGGFGAPLLFLVGITAAFSVFESVKMTAKSLHRGENAASKKANEFAASRGILPRGQLSPEMAQHRETDALESAAIDIEKGGDGGWVKRSGKTPQTGEKNWRQAVASEPTAGFENSR